MRDVIVFAKHAVQGLFPLIEQVGALKLTLILQLQEACEYVLYVLEYFQVELD